MPVDSILSLSSARVQVLTNPDLLHEIFKYFAFDEDRYLARCATVCQSFHEPVIRVLWRYLVDLLPLWHPLAPPNTPFPSISHDIDGHDDVLAYLQKISSAQAHLDPVRWDRFFWHARHVRGIRYFSHLWQSVNEATRLLVHAVMEKNGGTAVLPSLRHILWMGRLPAVTDLGESALIPFFTPTLRQAALQFVDAEEASVILLLRTLRESSPSLEQVSVDMGPELDAGLSIVQEVASFPRLCQVNIAQTCAEGFYALLTKPGLSRLVIDEISAPWAGLDHTISVFDLRDLYVGGAASVVLGLFDHVRFYSLEKTKISVSASVGTLLSPIEVTAFLARFYDSVSTSGVQALHFMLDQGDQTLPEYVRGEEPHLRDLLAPILRISDLRSFSLEVRGVIARSDAADFEALATAWPKLESLSIPDGLISESQVPLSALHHLHRHCPRLKNLSIASLSFPVIGVDEIPAPLDRSSAPSHALRYLAVGGEYVFKARMSSLGPVLSDDGAEAIARYLLDLFPNLDARRYALELHDSERRGPLPSFMEFDDRWWRVVGHICSICSARCGRL